MKYPIEILTRELLNLKAHLRQMLRIGDEKQYTFNLTPLQDQVNELEVAIELLHLRQMLRIGDEKQYTFNLTALQDQVNDLEVAIELLQKNSEDYLIWKRHRTEAIKKLREAAKNRVFMKRES
jgi:hypothetical protein